MVRRLAALLAFVALAGAPSSVRADAEPASAETAGASVSEPGPRESHPLPRVVVDVVGSKGGLEGDVIQRAARAQLWGKVIGCYKVGARKDQALTIDRTFGVEIAGGKAKAPAAKKTKRRKGKQKDAPEVAPSAQVEQCLHGIFTALELPRARRSSARIRIRVWPGDEPIE